MPDLNVRMGNMCASPVHACSQKLLHSDDEERFPASLCSVCSVFYEGPEAGHSSADRDYVLLEECICPSNLLTLIT